ncbi:MAG: GDSL-type esterase/lipase family protein [bacterium]
MNILVLGNSDTQGVFSDGPTWSGIARDRVAANLAEEVVVTEAGFSAVSASGAAYAERKIRELSPDVVILPLGTFAFTVGFTWKRIEGLFGKRIAARYRRAEETFDRRTREKGEQPHRLNQAARKLIRRGIGTQPLISQKDLTKNYAEIIRVISRFEDTDLLLVAYPAERGRHVRVGRIEERRKGFLADVQAEANRHHYRLLDSGPLFAGGADDGTLLTADGFHLQRGGHELLGQAVAAAVVERLGVGVSA